MNNDFMEAANLCRRARDMLTVYYGRRFHENIHKELNWFLKYDEKEFVDAEEMLNGICGGLMEFETQLLRLHEADVQRKAMKTS